MEKILFIKPILMEIIKYAEINTINNLLITCRHLNRLCKEIIIHFVEKKIKFDVFNVFNMIKCNFIICDEYINLYFNADNVINLLEPAIKTYNKSLIRKSLIFSIKSSSNFIALNKWVKIMKKNNLKVYVDELLTYILFLSWDYMIKTNRYIPEDYIKFNIILN